MFQVYVQVAVFNKYLQLNVCFFGIFNKVMLNIYIVNVVYIHVFINY